MKKIIIAITLLSTFVAQSCLDLRSCNFKVEGRYYINNNESITNYLDLNKDGTFQHFYKKGEVELSHLGKWKKNEKGYCRIELDNWKTYNEDGENFKELASSFLFINGKYLDIGPDGESSTSFRKK